MLHLKTIEPDTFAVLNQLMAIPEMKLKHFSVNDFITFHKEKFSTQNLFITVPQAISYFADAEDSEDPISLKKQTWESVKAFIQKKISDYLK